jgi:recombinational DNA repair protein (RecF pathway)
MKKQQKLKKCKLCRNKIPKKEVCYFGGNKVCQKCWKRLKSPIPTIRRESWLSKFAEEMKLRKEI